MRPPSMQRWGHAQARDAATQAALGSVPGPHAAIDAALGSRPSEWGGHARSAWVRPKPMRPLSSTTGAFVTRGANDCLGHSR
eukprot:2890802-Alexandrium_andersonii.AAC.1